MSLSPAAQAALAAITATAETELAKVDDYWRSQQPEPPDPEPPFTVTTIGLSAEADLWEQRLASVGEDGVTARRIFCQLTSDGRDQADLIRDALEAHMLPVVSYKVPNVASAIDGKYDGWAEEAAQFLESFGVPIVVAVWHEPYGDMNGPQFVDLQERLIPIFHRGELLPGPILNGWLLDRKADVFATYLSPHLLANVYAYVGIDTYQPDDPENDTRPGDRIPPLLQLLDDLGHPDMLVGVGEYNGFDADAIAHAGEVFLAEPRVRFACMWNSASDPGGLGTPLEGDRLEAFKATKADERARQGW